MLCIALVDGNLPQWPITYPWQQSDLRCPIYFIKYLIKGLLKLLNKQKSNLKRLELKQRNKEKEEEKAIVLKRCREK